jgi:hypothetical protein
VTVSRPRPWRRGHYSGKVPPRLPLPGAYVYPVRLRKELKFGYCLVVRIRGESEVFLGFCPMWFEAHVAVR